MTIQVGDASANPVFTDVTATGSPGALNATVTATLRGQACATVQVTGIGSMTLTFEGTTDGANFDFILATPIAGGAAVSTTTTNGHWVNLNVAGLTTFRVRVSAFTSGTATVTVNASQGSALPNFTAAGTQKVDLASVNGTALGTPTNFGTTPTAVVAASVNASLFSGTTALGTPNTFGTTAPTGAALGCNVSPFIGTTLAVAASAGVQKVGISGATGATMDAVVTAATAPANGLATLVENVTTAPSLTTGQSVMAQADYQGSLFVKPYRRGQTVSQATTISATGATTILAAQAAGIFADISALVISVTPQATTASSFTASLSDGTKTFIFDLVAEVTVAAGTNPFIVYFDPPLAATTAAVAWTLNLSATNTVHVTVNAVLQKAS